ncbi:ATP-dependent RNA helicase dbp4 [Myzus persicae]|uniref:ATP-dependent RNA helicase dbp4 n=1 Tax=Myzus persicae TaxID=13164 RepID=UPI000B933CD4|nr:ATP-dependent RNA helicase dbp4 [Myzus persicae]
MTTDRIPIWLYDKKLWINDADRRTTCADVATTLTGHGSDYAVAVDGAHTATMVADPGVRVLKIWQSLRPDQKLCLRKVGGNGYHHRANNIDSGGGCDDDDAASEMSGYRGAHRKRRREVVVKYASRTVHPKRLSNTQAAEELLKLILEQSDTIRAQLKKLQDRDKKIEKIETETHRTRADALGSNYLLDAYLGGGGGCGDDKEEKDSGITEGASVENDDHDDENEDDDDDRGGCGVGGRGVVGEIADSGTPPPSSTQEAIAYLERIVKINKKLYEFEERLIRLYVNVERCRDQEQLLDELKRAETEMADTERLYRENTLLIRDTDTELRARLGYIEQLQYEAAIVDSENEYLMGSIEHLQGRHHNPQNQVENYQPQHHAAACRVLDTLV